MLVHTKELAVDLPPAAGATSEAVVGPHDVAKNYIFLQSFTALQNKAAEIAAGWDLF